MERKGADRSRLVVIHNWADTDAIVPLAKDNAFARAHDLTGKTVVLHAGSGPVPNEYTGPGPVAAARLLS